MPAGISSVQSLSLVRLSVTHGRQHPRLPRIACSSSLMNFLFFFYVDRYAGFVYLETAAPQPQTSIYRTDHTIQLLLRTS